MSEVLTRIALEPGLERIVRPGVLAFEDLRVVERDERMDEGIERTASALREGREQVEPVIAAVRAMYRRFGIDPTKTRPSSEALLRRLRRLEPLPRVNSLVDICNWCSVETQLPFGLYDLDRIEPPIVLRLGREGEEYAGIRKDVVHLAGRPTLADARGPFGNPTSDSARTMVTLETRRVLFVIFAPADLVGPLERAMALTAERVAAFAGGREIPSR